MPLVDRMKVLDPSLFMPRREMRLQGDLWRFLPRAGTGRHPLSIYILIEVERRDVLGDGSCSSLLCAADEQVGEETDALPESGGGPHDAE